MISTRRMQPHQMLVSLTERLQREQSEDDAFQYGYQSGINGVARKQRFRYHASRLTSSMPDNASLLPLGCDAPLAVSSVLFGKSDVRPGDRFLAAHSTDQADSGLL